MSAGRVPVEHPQSRRGALRLEPSPELLLALSGWVAVAIVALQAPVPLRTIAVFGFSASGPGLALTAFLVRRDRLERFVLTLALSLAVATLVSEALALAHAFSALTTLVTLAALTTVLVGVHARDRLAGPGRRAAQLLSRAFLGPEEERKAAMPPRPNKEVVA
ncbi:MAG TPA: hypothetical protein VMU75_11595 [Acidimicrobiales bacterium]|nr:hypothetical protein [Acidimicrobiales bacterium]